MNNKKCSNCNKEFYKKYNESKKYWIDKKYCCLSCRNKGKKLPNDIKKKMSETQKRIGNKPPYSFGKNHHNWKGNNAGITPKHIWVRKWKGKPDHCEICGTTDKRQYNWANIDHKYRRVLEDYISMCVPCHRIYDYNFLRLHL